MRDSSDKKEKKGFDLNFSKEKPIIDYNYRVGANFLPPISQEAKKNLQQFTHLNIDKRQRLKPTKKTEDVDDKKMIHSFDPIHLSQPKYSDKYQNAKNANDIRHLLGGR